MNNEEMQTAKLKEINVRAGKELSALSNFQRALLLSLCVNIENQIKRLADTMGISRDVLLLTVSSTIFKTNLENESGKVQ